MGNITFENVASLSDSLSPLDKIRLVQHIMSSLQNDIEPKTPRESLAGIWRDTNITAEEIDAARKEMWASFPRKDI